MIGIAMYEVTTDEGMTASEMMKLYDLIGGSEAIPYEVNGCNSCAIGLISIEFADKELDYNYSEGSFVYELIKSVISDMENETEDGLYNNGTIWLNRK